MTHDVRRRSDGSIDFDFAPALRRSAARRGAMTRLCEPSPRWSWRGAIGFALLLPSGSNRDHDRIAAPGDHSSQTR